MVRKLFDLFPNVDSFRPLSHFVGRFIPLWITVFFGYPTKNLGFKAQAVQPGVEENDKTQAPIMSATQMYAGNLRGVLLVWKDWEHQTISQRFFSHIWWRWGYSYHVPHAVSLLSAYGTCCVLPLTPQPCRQMVGWVSPKTPQSFAENSWL